MGVTSPWVPSRVAGLERWQLCYLGASYVAGTVLKTVHMFIHFTPRVAPKGGSIISPIFQPKKLQFREIRSHVPGNSW